MITILKVFNKKSDAKANTNSFRSVKKLRSQIYYMTTHYVY